VKWYFRDTSYNIWPIVWRHPQQLSLWSRRGFASPQSALSSLWMSSRPGTVLADELIIQQSQSFEGVAFRFVSWAVYSPYSTLNLRRPSFSSRRRSDLKQSSAARHIRAVTSRFLHSLENILLRTVIHNTFVVPAKWYRHFGHVNRFYLLTFVWEGIKEDAGRNGSRCRSYSSGDNLSPLL